MLLSAKQITKRFGDTEALAGVDLEVRAGEVHALLGANGSGKSTFAKVITGVYTPDGGTVSLDDRVIPDYGPAAAFRGGVRVVHQDAPLVENLSVGECVCLFRGYPRGSLGRVRWRQANRDARELFERLAIPVDPTARVAALRPAQRAMAALAIALADDEDRARLLVLDEATASIPASDSGAFLERAAQLAGRGLGVLLITHRLGEVTRFADRVTVLTDGHVIHRCAAADTDANQLVRLMASSRGASDERSSATIDTSALAERVGRVFAGRRTTSATPLVVTDLTGRDLRGASFTIGRGEIVGVAGLPESGVGELVSILSGLTRATGGAVEVRGKTLSRGFGPHEAIEHGLVLLPADRRNDGGIAALPARENVVLPSADRYWHRRARENRALGAVMDALDVNPPNPRQLFGQFSGGNQQKLSIGKWLLTDPAVLVLDDPTAGIDPASREIIFAAVREVAARGAGVLFLSTEPEQQSALCSRVLVFHGGQITGELAGDDLSHDAIAMEALA